MNLELAINNTTTNLEKVIEKYKDKGIDLSILKDFIRKKDFKKFVTLIGGGQISGSLSPFIHTFNSINHQEKQFLYTLLNMEEQQIEVEKVLQEIEQNQNILGSNVTMPYKIDVFKILEKRGKLDSSAILVGATNTLSKNEKGELIGYNSDMEGILLPIKTKLKDKIEETKKGYIIGDGGAAMASIGALLALGITDIIILARKYNIELLNHFNSEKVKQILEEKYGIKKEISLTYKNYDVSKDEINKISEMIDEKGIFISTLPFGFKKEYSLMSIEENELIKIKNKIVLLFDTIYDMNYGDTPLIQLAKQNGIVTCDGIDMLLNQAVKGFNLWTKGENLDLEVLERVFR